MSKVTSLQIRSLLALYELLPREDQFIFLKETNDLDRALFLKEIERYGYEDIIEQLIITEENFIESIPEEDGVKSYMNGTDIADMAKTINKAFRIVKYFCKVDCTKVKVHCICKQSCQHYVMLLENPKKLIKNMPDCDTKEELIDISKKYKFKRFNEKKLDTSVPLSNWEFYEGDGTPFCIYDLYRND